MKRRVDLLSCLRCGHEPLSRQGPIARCDDCGRGYPLRRPGLVDFLPTMADDDRAVRASINPARLWRRAARAAVEWARPADTALHEAFAGTEAGIILHIGCGAGALLEEIAPLPWRLRIGCDRRMGPLLRAHRRPSAGADLLLLRCSPYRLPLRDGCADAVAIERPYLTFKDPQAALFEVVRVLRPEGRLVCRAQAAKAADLEQLLAKIGFASYRSGRWWVARRLNLQTSPGAADQAL
jgi:ubiquinone/menaquinone biosynthesis C-methylase UbiE